MDFVLKQAQKERFAVGAFNVNTYDEMVAIAQTAQQLHLPVMMMASMSSAKFFGLKTFVDLCRALDAAYQVPIISHLDHCTDRPLLEQCVAAGFQSVMYDGSHGNYEDNVRVSAELAALCHGCGTYLEAELGVIAGEEGPVKSAYSVFTNADYVQDFVQRTQVDSLAVSIGNAHGFYKETPNIQFDLLGLIASRIPETPLVLHGGTGISNEDMRRAITMGISKINVGTEIRHTYVQSLKTYAAAHETDADVREFVKHLRQDLSASAEKYMRCFDCRA